MARAELLTEVPSAVRGFHYYRATWNPREAEELVCEREEDNPYDVFAIKVIDDNGRMEISRSTSFLILRGGTITGVLTETHYRRSPIMKGGLEIPCKLIIRMLRTSHNKSIAAHFEKLVAKFYSEPSDELIMGSFVEEPETSEPPKKNKKNGVSWCTRYTIFFYEKVKFSLHLCFRLQCKAMTSGWIRN